MDRLVLISILFILIVLLVENIKAFAGYKWITLKSGDPIPENSVNIGFLTDKYVGRARHYDDILPAEVTSNGLASVSVYGKEIFKNQFEILTSAPGECEWKDPRDVMKHGENLLHVGTAWNNEQIYIGISPRNGHIASVYLSSNRIFDWLKEYSYYMQPYALKSLFCNIKTEWIEHSPSTMTLPENAFVGALYLDEDQSEDRQYVARLIRDSDLIIGQFHSENKTATAYLYDGTYTESRYFDVLIGEPDEYTWVSASNGEIPDYAVVQGGIRWEPVFVGKIGTTIGGLTQFEAANKSDYQILIMNQSDMINN